MSSSRKNKTPAEDLIASLLKEVADKPDSEEFVLSDLHSPASEEVAGDSPDGLFNDSSLKEYESTKVSAYDSTKVVTPERTRITSVNELATSTLLEKDKVQEPAPLEIDSLFEPEVAQEQKPVPSLFSSSDDGTVPFERAESANETIPLFKPPSKASTDNYISKQPSFEQSGADDKTVAVTGFQNITIDTHEDNAKVSIGQNRSSAHSTGYASWGGNSEANLGQAEHLRIAQEKILDLEKDNEKLRSQNEELISASDIIRERSDLLTVQVNDFRKDKEGLEESFKNEVALLKGHLHRKESEFQKMQSKVDDLESRLKFDMKKIRIRERELENRLELIRAEKNAVTKSKDEQILDLRRKMDVLQMEVESYRQKCVDLNKLLENNQDSFKRTTRALRLAMANLELQDENKVSVSVALKKVD
ncbi:MAG: hypothetical protein WA160_11210 [Pseudobdellovibrio sp.]